MSYFQAQERVLASTLVLLVFTCLSVLGKDGTARTDLELLFRHVSLCAPEALSSACWSGIGDRLRLFQQLPILVRVSLGELVCASRLDQLTNLRGVACLRQARQHHADLLQRHRHNLRGRSRYRGGRLVGRFVLFRCSFQCWLGEHPTYLGDPRTILMRLLRSPRPASWHPPRSGSAPRCSG